MVTKKGKAKPKGSCLDCGLRHHCQKAWGIHGKGCSEWVDDCDRCKNAVRVNGHLFIDPKECWACERTPQPEHDEVKDNFVRRSDR